MKLLALLLIIIVIAFVCVVAYKVATEGVIGLRRWSNKRAHTHGDWTKDEIKGENGLEVYIVEPGTERKVLVEAEDGYGNLLSCARWGGDFEGEIEILRSAARQRLLALNDPDRNRLR